VEDVPICFGDNYLQPLVDCATARGIPPEERLVLMSLSAFQRNLVRRNGPEEMGGWGEYKDSRVEQDMKVEVVTSVGDHLGCKELVFPPATTTLQQVADEVARHGLPLDIQRVVLMPTSVFTTDDIEALIAKLKAGLTEYGADNKDHAEPIHDFLPPIKQKETQSIRNDLEALQTRFSGAFPGTDCEQLHRLCVCAREKLRAEVQHAPSIRDTLRTAL
jgi:hypothetical protein